MIRVAFAYFLAVAATAKLLPPSIEICARSDPNFNQCFHKGFLTGLKTLKHGYKPLGVTNLEPFLVPSLELGGTETASVSLQQKYKNLKIYGLSETTIQDVEAKFQRENCYWRFDAVLPMMKMEGEYTIKGKLLLFVVNSQGKCNHTFHNLKAKHEMNCEFFKKDGKEFLRATNYSIVMEPGTMVFNFDNLVEGNAQLSAELLKTLNENALSVFADYKSGFEQSFSLIFLEIGKRIVSNVPLDQLFLD